MEYRSCISEIGLVSDLLPLLLWIASAAIEPKKLSAKPGDANKKEDAKHPITGLILCILI
jgi:hypothetical protein